MKKNLKYTLKNALNSVDLFQEPINLNMEGRKFLTSPFGGFLSLIIVFFLVSQVVLQTISMIGRKNPTVVQTNQYEDDPSIIYLNSTNNFIFAVSTSRDDININMTNNSVISFTGSYVRQIRTAEGTLNKKRSKIIWAPCDYEQFPKEVFPQEKFSSYALKYAYCPIKINHTDTTSGLCPDDIKASYPDCITPLEFTLRGTFLSPIFEYIQLKVILCDPNDSSAIQGLKCTPEDIQNVFNTSTIKMNLYYSNNLINPVNYETPNKTYIDTFFWQLSPTAFQSTDIFLDAVTVEDYNDYIYQDNYHNDSFYGLAAQSFREMQSFRKSNILEWNMRRSNINVVTIRKYPKILDVISSIGGIAKILMIMGAFIAMGYTRYKAQIILSNELYNFDLKNKKKTDTSASKRKLSKNSKDEPGLRTQEKQHTGIFTIAVSSLQTKSGSNPDSSIRNYFDNNKKENRELKYGHLQYFKGLLNYLFCRRSVEEELAERAQKQAIKDLDVIKIVKKLKEIDILKRLILNRDQREAFDFLEKPLITIDQKTPIEQDSMQNLANLNNGEQEQDSSLLPKSSSSPLSKYSKLYLTYTRLKKDTNPRNYKHNKKLLNMMGKDLMEVFQKVDKFMENDPDPSKFEEIVQKLANSKPLKNVNLTETPPSNNI